MIENRNTNHDPVRVDTFGLSRRGADRPRNADHFLVAEIKRAARIRHASEAQLKAAHPEADRPAHVLLVADGVSGQAGAREASRLVVDEMIDSLLNAVPLAPTLSLTKEAELRRGLQDAVVRCDERVSEAAGQVSSAPEMASTLTLAFVRWPSLFVVHAGDSRAYLLSEGNIEQLTTDHTVAERMVQVGELDESKAAQSRFANVLWNAVGGSTDVEPQLVARELQSGDAVLLCTDGLTSYLNDRSMESIVRSADDAEDACRELVQLVTAVGGRDDVTVALARFDEPAHASAIAAEPPRRDTTRARENVASREVRVG